MTASSVQSICDECDISTVDMSQPDPAIIPRNVEAFVELAGAGQATRAADALFISQPALTARIQSLERALGTTLFDRTRRGMVLTEAGHAFLPYAERSLAALRDGSELVAELVAGGAGALAVGAVPSVSAYVLPEVVARFSSAHPGIRLRIRTAHTPEIVEAVSRGEIHLGIVREVDDPRVRSEPLYEDRLVLVVHPEHPFAGRTEVDAPSLATVRLMLFDRTSSYFELTTHLVRQAGVSPHDVVELDSIETAKRMVLRNLGVALLPEVAVSRELADGALVRVAAPGIGEVRRRIAIVEAVSGQSRNPATIGFRDALEGLLTP